MMEITKLLNIKAYMDGSNFQGHFAKCGKKLDFKLFQNFIKSDLSQFDEMKYYDSSTFKKKAFHHYISKELGWSCISRKAKYDQRSKSYKMNMDTYLITDLLSDLKDLDGFILCAADGDYVPVLERPEVYGKCIKVIVPSLKCTSLELIKIAKSKIVDIEYMYKSMTLT